MYKTVRTRQCLICHQSLNQETNLFFYLYHPSLCQRCIQQFEIVEKTITLQGYCLVVLYRYNDFFRKILYQYKALDDYALKDAFLNSFPDLKRKYRNHTVVIIPSSQEDNARRGFCPNEELVKIFSNHLFLGLYKEKKYKQTKQKDRTLIKKVLKINQGYLLENKKVLIFDDVMTTSNTIQAALSLVKQYHPKSIEILVLSCPYIQRFLNK